MIYGILFLTETFWGNTNFWPNLKQFDTCLSTKYLKKVW